MRADPRTLGGWVSWLLALGLGSSRALLSLSTVALLLLALWQGARRGWRIPRLTHGQRGLGWASMALWGLALLSGLLSEDLGAWSLSVYRKLPLLVLPLAYWVLLPFSPRQMAGLALAFVGSHTLISLASLTDLALHYGHWDGHQVAVITGVSHIYFGVSLAFSTCLAAFLAWRKQAILHAAMPKVWLVLALLNGLALHFFTSRTGIVALYSGLGLMVGYAVWKQRNWKLALGGLLLLLGLPLAAYQWGPTFQVRVDTTLQDWYAYQDPGQDISYNSASLRLLAWDTAWELIQDQPWLGVGLTEVKAAMRQQYEANGAYRRAREPLMSPHNQYITYWVGLGLGGVLALLALLLAPAWLVPVEAKPLAWAAVGVMLASLMFENILERQMGMTLFSVIYLWVPVWAHSSEAYRENN